MLYIWEDQDIHHGTETVAFVGESRSNYTIIGFEFGDLFAIAKESTGQIVVSPLTRQGMAEWLTMNGHIPAEIISHGPGNHKNPYVWADSIVLKNLPTHPNMRCVTTPFVGVDPAEPGNDTTVHYEPNEPSLPDFPEGPMCPPAPPAPPAPQVSRRPEPLGLRSGAIPSSPTPVSDNDRPGDLPGDLPVEPITVPTF
ncbi:TPA: hypothetical protein NH725_004730 [Pseudomonas aeruginosa]|nr:hypothetical protein [Pseudomonas aeruginosa]